MPNTGGRPSKAALGVVKVGPDYSDEFPDGDATCTELFATLYRTGSALWDELERCMVSTFEVTSGDVLNALTVIEGAEEPITPGEIGERVYKSSASVTAMLDLLERRGWVRRAPNPNDRRSVFVEMTPDGQAVADQLLPGIRKLELAMLGDLNAAERKTMLRLLGKVLNGIASTAEQPPTVLNGRRHRPSRLH
jgi:DNA-binding MarR family transcriptional regulator